MLMGWATVDGIGAVWAYLLVWDEITARGDTGGRTLKRGY